LIPTPSPITEAPTLSVRQVLIDVALQGGKEFMNVSTYQSQGLIWLEKNHFIQVYSTEQIVQRYALACLYFTSFGVANEYSGEDVFEWKSSDGWISDENECTWYGISCVEGNVIGIDLSNNNLSGHVPMEFGLLGRSLEFLDLSGNTISNKGDDLAWIADLKKLRELQVYFCNFDSIGISTFIGKLQRLSKFSYGRGAPSQAQI
jgi:hypothetical protein